MEGAFKLLVIAVAAGILIALIAGFFSPIDEDPITAIKRQLSAAQSIPGKLTPSKTLKFLDYAGFMSETFENELMNVAFKCNLGLLCSNKDRIDFEERKIEIQKMDSLKVSSRCKDEENLFICKVYFGTRPAQIDELEINFSGMEFNEEEERYETEASTEFDVDYTFVNSGGLEAENINAFAEFYLIDKTAKLVSEETLLIGNLGINEIKEGTLNLKSPKTEGQYILKVHFEGDDTGYETSILDFFVKPRPCYAEKCTEPEWLKGKCITHCSCDDCVFGFTCRGHILESTNEQLKISEEIKLQPEKSNIRGSNLVDFEVDESFCELLDTEDPRLMFQDVVLNSGTSESEIPEIPLDPTLPSPPELSDDEDEIRDGDVLMNFGDGDGVFGDRFTTNILESKGANIDFFRPGDNVDFSRYKQIWIIDKRGADIISEELYNYYLQGGNIVIASEGVHYCDGKDECVPCDCSLRTDTSASQCDSGRDLSRELAAKFGITINENTCAWPQRFLSSNKGEEMCLTLNSEEIASHPIMNGVTQWQTSFSDSKIENYFGKAMPLVTTETGDAAMIAIEGPGKIIFDSSYFKFVGSCNINNLIGNIYEWFEAGSGNLKEKTETTIYFHPEPQIYRDPNNAKIIYDAENNKIIANLYKYDSQHLLTGISIGLEIKSMGKSTVAETESPEAEIPDEEPTTDDDEEDDEDEDCPGCMVWSPVNSDIYASGVQNNEHQIVKFAEEESISMLIYLIPIAETEENFKVEFENVDLEQGEYNVRVFVESHTPPPPQVNCNHPETTAVIIIGEDNELKIPEPDELEEETEDESESAEDESQITPETPVIVGPEEYNPDYKILILREDEEGKMSWWTGGYLQQNLESYGVVTNVNTAQSVNFGNYDEIWILELWGTPNYNKYAEDLFHYYLNGGNVIVVAEGTDFYVPDGPYECKVPLATIRGCRDYRDISRVLGSYFGLAIEQDTVGWPSFFPTGCIDLTKLGTENVPNPNHPLIRGISIWETSFSDSKIEGFEGKSNITPIVIDELGGGSLVAIDEPGKGKMIFQASWWNYKSSGCSANLLIHNVHNWFVN